MPPTWPKPTAREDWCQELAPWLAVLKNRLVIDVPAMPTLEDLENLWIRVDALDGTDYEPRLWTMIIEALELLELFVRVDAVAGWRCVFNIVARARRLCTFAETMLPSHKVIPQFVLEIDSQEISPYFQSVFLALRRMIGEDDQPWEPPSSPEFARVKQRLLDAWARDRGGRAFDRGREGRVVVKLQLILSTSFQAQPVPFMMQHTLQLAKASRTLLPRNEGVSAAGSEPVAGGDANAEQLRVRQRRAVFCFVAVDVRLVGHPATPVVLLDLLRVASEGLPITELALDQVGKLLPYFCAMGSFLMGVWNACGLKRFEFSCGRLDRDSAGAVCSALALSRTISDFAFIDSRSGRDADGNRLPSQVDRPVWWPWLAYALFSQDAKHHITRVKLEVSDFTMTDVEAMRAVLDHANPLAYVCALDEPDPKSPVLSTPPKAAKLKPETRVVVGHRIVIAREQHSVDHGTATLTSEVPFSIVRNNETEDYLEIVFPGAGVGWIDRADVQEIVSSERRENISVQCLELTSIDPESYPAVLELLRLVGGQLESLTLDSLKPLSDDFLTTVCTVCPLLKSLKLKHEIHSTRWLVSPALTNRPRCRLERLHLPSQVTDLASLGALFKALSGGDHEVSKSLRAFCFGTRWNPMESETILPELCAQWLEMLRSNWRLEQCVFQVMGDSFATKSFQNEICKHNGERIFVPQALAFLSVLFDPSPHVHKGKRLKMTRTPGDQVSARFKLANETAELILQMAGVPLRRICA